MTTPVKSPLDDEEERVELETNVSSGSVPQPVMGSPMRNTTSSKSASGIRRMSTISEQEPDKMDTTSRDSRRGSEWGGSSFSMCSDKFKNGSGEPHQPDPGDDCAGLLLACLHCRFYEFMVLLPDSCERAVGRCFPSYNYIKASSERDQQGKDCCNYKLELDCSCCGSCQETGELIELAMEISEVCYR